MKRKITDQATATDTTTVAADADFLTKNMRSKIPRRKRAHISPILFDFDTSNASSLKLNRNGSFNSADEISCNTTIESAALPPNAAFRGGNEVILKPLKKEVAEVSVSENSCVESCSVVTESKRNDVVPTESTEEYWKFEAEEDEESYRLLRSRERNQAVKVKDYVEEYDFATDYGELIIEQRLLMVNWIIELSRKKDLQNETMFLGVRLLDRFLSKGFFTSRKNIQLLGIACFTLAMRIEENQPYNSVRQKSFYVGSNVYSRYEVVAMEWVVQEVLKFHCISATIYNFLWFYLKAVSADEGTQKKAKYLAGLSLLDHSHLRYWPSTVAAALVILVSVAANRDESSLRVMEAHVRTKVDDLPECIKVLEKFHNLNHSSKEEKLFDYCTT
ncbi:hypothetical protein SOVF_194920 [Spinacia oleracea]|nr:hypothetical protein SOVF_194920 [Spinacia oleracea]